MARSTRWRCRLLAPIGLAIGRIGCYAVGEHFGRTTSFFLGVRYDGGPTREGLEPQFPTPADLQLNGVGTVFHQTALLLLHLDGNGDGIDAASRPVVSVKIPGAQ